LPVGIDMGLQRLQQYLNGPRHGREEVFGHDFLAVSGNGVDMVSPNVISLEDRYLGTLLGLACGDALGGPVEFLSREAIAVKYPSGVTEFVGGGWLNLEPGEVTDDTQQALILAGALTAKGLEIDKFAAGLITWYRGNPKDIGNTTRLALEALLRGTPPLEAGAVALAERGADAAAANGGVMRCAPVALRFRTDPAALIQASLNSARVTHAEERASWATVAINQAIVHFLRGGSIAAAPEAAVAGVPNEEVRAAVLGAVQRQSSQVGAGGFVLETIGAAFWALGNSRNAREAIERGVALGEDADSTGAVVGAMAGAAYGADALPDSWRDNVQFRDHLAAESMRLLMLSGHDAV
jgi:ADP-ribosyl-[dinitrogen reductase] hydrolase